MPDLYAALWPGLGAASAAILRNCSRRKGESRRRMCATKTVEEIKRELGCYNGGWRGCALRVRSCRRTAGSDAGGGDCALWCHRALRQIESNRRDRQRVLLFFKILILCN